MEILEKGKFKVKCYSDRATNYANISEIFKTKMTNN